MTYVYGVDVSNHNGAFNWTSLENKIKFAAAKASEGTGFTDPYFNANWNAMGQMGIFRWAYHFAHPSQDAANQAVLFTDVVTKAGLRKGDNFLMDLEVTDGMPAKEVEQWAVEFCNQVQKICPGHRVVFYSYPFFIDQEGLSGNLLSRYLWLAEYGVAVPSLPSGWNEWMFWQYHAPKYAGPDSADWNAFNGNADRLEHFCTTTGVFKG